MVGKAICPKCRGNGYLKTSIEEGREEVITDCNKCNSQGEIAITEEDIELMIKKIEGARLQ